MLTVRRIYLYLVAAISLIAVTWATIGLARLIIREGVGQGQITDLATMLAIIIVGLPIFLFHWLMAQRLAIKSQEEQESPVRQAYFYGVMAAGAVPIISNIYYLSGEALSSLIGGIHFDFYPYNLSAGEHLAAILIWAVVWIYIWRQTSTWSERRDSPAYPINAGIRRLYLLLFSAGGLVMATWGAVSLIQALMDFATGVFWRTPVADFSAQLLVGTLVWVGHWLILQDQFLTGDPVEERSVLRKIYLYLAVFITLLMTLSSGTLLLKRLLELIMGAPPASEPLLSQLSIPIPILIVGGVFWAYHWQVLRRDATKAPEAPRQAGVRRIYAYLVALIGLMVLLIGVTGLVTLLTELIISPAAVGYSYYREQTALYTAIILVGGPVWLLPWRRMQKLATAPPASNQSEPSPGAGERGSTIRKIYLYYFVFVASLAIFGSVGWFVFHILTALLGADLPSDFVTLVINALLISMLAVGVWLYHWRAIRLDGQLDEQEQARRFSDVLVVVIDGDEGKLGQAITQQLVRRLPGIQLRPVGTTPQAREAMAGQEFSASILEMAHYIIGSGQILSTGEIGLTVAANPAMKLAVPLGDQNWIWTGVSNQSMDHYAQQAARGIEQAIDGQEINFERELDAGMITAIVAGVILLLFIGGGLIGLVGVML